ncbi:MAG: DUF2982 domain-containing protein [Psychrobium sp.]
MKLPLRIKSPAPNYKQFFMVAGVVLLVLAIMGQLWWPSLSLQFGLLCLAAVSLFFIGIAKHFEPSISLELTQQSLRYFHRYGRWKLDWENISRIHIPRFYYQLQQKETHYIGVKVIDLEKLIDNVSPRLASRIIHEHRDILALAISQGDLTTSEAQIDLTPFKMPSGFQVGGPLAPFFHQMVLLEKHYGAHLFIPFSSFNEAADEVVNRMNTIRKTR